MRIHPLAAGLATLAVGVTTVATSATTATATATDDVARIHQVALVDGTDEQLESKSAASGTGQTASYDGSIVVFASDAPLVPEDDNGEPDVYLRDLDAGTTTLVSQVGGVPGNDISHEPTISADGRYVAFTTWADNLTEDTNGHVLDVVVKDILEDEIVLASVSTAELQRDRNSFSPVISDDGRSVAFQTFGSFSRRDDDNREDVYVRDLDTGRTKQGSLLPGTDRDVRGSVLVGDLSGDGSTVTFGNNNNLWARNVLTGETIRFWQEPDSPPCQTAPDGGSAGRPAISGDGRFAAFASCALDLPGEDGAHTDVYRINLTSGRIVRVHPEGNGNSYLPSLSYTGRYIGFGTEASNFVKGDTSSNDAFVADVQGATVTIASQALDGTEGNKPSARNDVAINGDGQTLVYQSYADDLVEGDVFDQREVFVWQAR